MNTSDPVNRGREPATPYTPFEIALAVVASIAGGWFVVALVAMFVRGVGEVVMEALR